MKKKINPEEKIDTPLLKEDNVSMDFDTYSKVKGKLKPTDKVTIIDKSPSQGSSNSSTSSSSSMAAYMEEGEMEPEAIIEPQDQATIKYLSNVKDATTGEVSKPFTIGDKRYQMVRGITPSKEVVMAVYCHDDMDEAGNNMIHPVEYFEENIAKPMKEMLSKGGVENKPVNEIPKNLKATDPTPQPSNKELSSLKLAEFKHFLVNKKNGKVRKFKHNEELAKAMMDENETYMNLNELKKYMEETLFGPKKSKMSEVAEVPERPDVGLAIDQMVQKMKPYMVKLNEPLEKMQFIVKLTSMLQLDAKFFPKLITLLKQGNTQNFAAPKTATQADSTQSSTQTSIAEAKVITKNELQETINPKKVIRTVKVKDIK